MAWISWVGRYSSTNFLPCSRCHRVLFPVFLSPRMTIFTLEGKTMYIKLINLTQMQHFRNGTHIFNYRGQYTWLAALLTIILDPLGKAPLQTLVHRLQASRDVLVPELPWLRSHQLLQCWKHLDEALLACAAARCGTVELHWLFVTQSMNENVYSLSWWPKEKSVQLMKQRRCKITKSWL